MGLISYELNLEEEFSLLRLNLEEKPSSMITDLRQHAWA